MSRKLKNALTITLMVLMLGAMAGTLLYRGPGGRKPENFQFAEGEMPEFTRGERPEMPEGEMPEFTEGEMPEFAEGERPEMPAGRRPGGILRYILLGAEGLIFILCLVALCVTRCYRRTLREVFRRGGRQNIIQEGNDV